jgi:NlpC/P60 family putative phage cell wall peptidase
MTADRAIDERAAAVAEARDWIGTPWRHRASLRGAGADCLGLILGVWRAVYGAEPARVPPYPPGWGAAAGDEALWRALGRAAGEIAPDAAATGDLLLFRMRGDAAAGHLGLRAATADGAPTVIHAYTRRGVVESALGPALARRVVAAFRLPRRAR